MRILNFFDLIMITESDIKSDLRDLVYLEEEAYGLLRHSALPTKEKQRILDNLQEKQVILTKMIQFFNANVTLSNSQEL